MTSIRIPVLAVLLASAASAWAQDASAPQAAPERAPLAASAPLAEPPVPVLVPAPVVAPEPPPPAPRPVHYRCEGDVAIEAVYPPLDRADGPVTISWLGGRETLKIARSGSGARYVNRSYVWWTKGDTAFLSTRGGRMLVRNCNAQ